MAARSDPLRAQTGNDQLLLFSVEKTRYDQIVLGGVEARRSADPRCEKRHLIESDFNQVLSLTGPSGTSAFQYDANGNQTQKQEPSGTTTLTWDARDRLKQVTTPTATSRYGYDSQGLRVSIEDFIGARRIVIDDVEEFGEYESSSGNRRARFDHDPSGVDRLLAQATAQGKNFFLSDTLGSVYGLADQAGVESARYGYDAYGARAIGLERVSTSWSFDGRPLDADGLLYGRARYRDPGLSMWLQPDPLFTGGTYTFAGNSPVQFVDPSGLLFTTTVDATIFKIAVALAGLSLGLSRYGNLPERERLSLQRDLRELLSRIFGRTQKTVDVIPPLPPAPTPPNDCPDDKCKLIQVIKEFWIDPETFDPIDPPRIYTDPYTGRQVQDPNYKGKKWQRCKYKCKHPNGDITFHVGEWEAPCEPFLDPSEVSHLLPY